MGVALHATLLRRAGIRPRVVRPIDPPFAVPDAVMHPSMVTFSLDPSPEERLAAMTEAYAATPDFFEEIVGRLLAGPERIVALSLFRNNADVSLFVAKLVKERRPSSFVVLGGPEAVEEPRSLCQPWVDAVVGADAEAVFVPLVRAVLDGRPERAATLRNVWSAGAADDPRARPALERPPLLTIDFEPLLPLLVGDDQPTVPLLLNWGCPYGCAFCSNRTIYGRFERGSVTRVLDEMDAIVSSWVSLHGGDAPGLGLQLSDATTNAIPAQFDELLRGVARLGRSWRTRPTLRGQTLFDARLTAERVRLMNDAAFTNTFSGLDAVDDDQRRSLQKPGQLAQVREALSVWHREAEGKVGIGIPVGLPGETDERFERVERFVEDALGLASRIECFTVLPYVWFLSSQDEAFLRQNRGQRRGVLWRADAPGGDPAVRARRYMRLFERIGDRATALSPVPPYIALPAMLPEEPRERLDAFLERFGRSFDQLSPPRRAAPASGDEAAAGGPWASARAAIEASALPDGWSRSGLAWGAERGAGPALVALFSRVDGERMAVELKPRDPARRAYAATSAFNVSYLKQWEGRPCGMDAALLDGLVRALRHAERDA
jgi:hypothetical protein